MSIIKGYFIEVDGKRGHEHSIGGFSEISTCCPNCQDAFMLHMRLDADDIKLEALNYPFKFIDLLYCMRCPLAWYDFQYRQTQKNEIEILQSFNKRDIDTEKEWRETIGINVLPERKIALREMPLELQELFFRASEGEKLTNYEEYEIARETNSFASKELGGYPIVDSINQVGGITYMPQNVDEPLCLNCKNNGILSTMIFLASLTNDSKKHLRFTYEGIQILFFICKNCHSIHVQSCN